MTSNETDRVGTPGRPLRRRTADRVIGGVAGGLGDYFNVDPLLFRIGFVGLIIFGGAGLVLYIIGWLLLPAEGRDVSMLEGFLRRLALTPRRIGWVALAIVVFLLVNSAMNSGGYSLREGPLGIPGVIWALGVMVAGVLLLRRHEAVPAGTPESAVVAQPRAAPVRAVPRPRSPLAWYVVAAMLMATGLLALVGRAADVEVTPGQFFGAALAIVGIGLVIGAWWGRARILILIALLLLPLGVTASFVTAPLEGGFGGVRFTPANAAELRDEYRLMGGTLILDLTDLSIPAQPVHIAASVAAGKLVVIVPPDASVELHARMGAGQVTVFDYYRAGTILTNAGTSLDEQYVRRHRFGPTYILDLQGGIGDLFVTNSRINW